MIGPAYLVLEQQGQLAQREQQLYEMMEACCLCARTCGVNRLAGQTGVCGTGAELEVASCAPHFGEEAPLVGRAGSGTIFFSRCNLLCAFCQNADIAHLGCGQVLGEEQLAQQMLRLQAQGCHNINLVTPSHQVPGWIRALRLAIGQGLQIPLVYNTGSYDSLEVIELLRDVVDIYMPDIKFFDPSACERFLDAADYPEVATRVIKQMHQQVSDLQLDSHNVAQRGVLIRHLVMPGFISSSQRILSWIANELGANTYINVMDQYYPAHNAFGLPELSRRITRSEYQQVLTWAAELGLTRLDR